jgi:FHA domain
MAHCPKDGKLINLNDATILKKCSCPVCGAWVYPHLELKAGSIQLVFEEEQIFGQADIRTLADHATVSRNHARFYPTEEGWNLVSLSARNVTEVNGNTIATLETIRLREGDSLKFGRISFSVAFKRPPS